MKTKLEWISLFAVCLFISSCRGKMETGRFLENGKAIHGKMLNWDRNCLIGRPAEIACIDSFLLFYDRYEGRTITVFDAKNDRPVCRFLNEGQGPGEAVFQWNQ
ncbi:MAG: hypothetical protein LBJ01_07525 [Tannerella sp.]|jgi:hypothetical protein|nr:hypothetical protein [Tannerella sp.]